MRKKRLLKSHKFGAGGIVKVQPAEADSGLGRRMLEAEGPGALSVVKTLQSHFGAKVVWFRDGQGEAGRKPGWAE